LPSHKHIMGPGRRIHQKYIFIYERYWFVRFNLNYLSTAYYVKQANGLVIEAFFFNKKYLKHIMLAKTPIKSIRLQFPNILFDL